MDPKSQELFSQLDLAYQRGDEQDKLELRERLEKLGHNFDHEVLDVAGTVIAPPIGARRRGHVPHLMHGIDIADPRVIAHMEKLDDAYQRGDEPEKKRLRWELVRKFRRI